MAPREIKKVLVIKLSAMGDFILALAAAKKIRQAHPKAQITLLTTPPFEGLAKLCPYFNAVETDGRPEGLGDWLALVGRLRKARYDRIYDLQTSSRSSMIFYGLSPFAPEWSGIAAGCALPHRNPRRDQMHTLERHADQLKAAGIWPDAPTDPGSAPGPDVSWILRKVEAPRPVAGGIEARPYVLMAPGGSAHRPEKRWPIESYAQLARELYDVGFDIVVVGGPQESALARTIQKSVGKARDLTGRTDLARIAMLGARAALVVGNDTGPVHLAAAAGPPTLVLFSKASDPILSAPRGHVAALQAQDLADMPVAQVMQAARALTRFPGGANA
ncbi:MAG: glycosyltransferase family 9 protein [Phenylobacterium sp.]|uniref:glycosyltransferase family 9 protein n=1 Tax=Phenylobacterium sp. TaxID=1871053 RepID=UPI00271945EB|nr:glycosyltransferase family 9 protein [Phenylobacterium sp.]MDO8410140.1 glycosyltransferase family 9 protein [Phenylobacterium sp.]